MNNYLAEKKILAVTPFSSTGNSLAKNAMGFAEKIHATLLLLNPNVGHSSAANQGESALKEDDIELVITPSSENAEEFENNLIDAFNPFKDSRCKVLFVPEGHELKSIDKIIYITDIRYCDLHALKSMIDLFRPFNTEITLVNLSVSGLPRMDDESAKSLVESDLIPLLKYQKINFLNIKVPNVVDELESIVSALKPNLIAFASKKHAVYQRLFKSVQKVKPTYMNLPLLVFGC